MIKVNFINDCNFHFNKTDAKHVVEETLDKLGIRDVIVEVIFVDGEKIRELNKTHRKIDRPTDVLSFPQTQIKESKINILGSIVICPSVAEERSEKNDELIKHGLLHLAGFDHEKDQKKWDEAAKIVNHNL